MYIYHMRSRSLETHNSMESSSCCGRFDQSFSPKKKSKRKILRRERERERDLHILYLKAIYK
jgi:hypothetical protein